MAETISQVVGAVLDSGSVRALLAVGAAAAAASPVMRFFHDRREAKLREREVVARERMAEAAMIQAKILLVRGRK